MTEFQAQYLSLLIKQYYDQPNARDEILAAIGEWGSIYDFIVEFRRAFDLDTATGDRLDKIGKIVGLSRSTPNALAKVRFGFIGSDSPVGFGSIDDTSVGGPFLSLRENRYTDLQLDDADYRLFLRAKVAVNQSSAFITSNEYISLQDAVDLLFEGQGRVIDNYNMSLTLYVPYSVDAERVKLFIRLNLLPRPQGVRYSTFIHADADSFRLRDNADVTDSVGGFGTLLDSGVGGGFASIMPITV